MSGNSSTIDRRGPLVRSACSGVGNSALKGLLRPAGWFYGRALLLRRRAYRSGLLHSERLDAPVISVGNITTGGTGKTPMVELLARRCIEKGRRPAILSRGYNAHNGAQNDEALQLARMLPEVPHYPGPNRISTGRQALRDGADCLILDDGFQHRRIIRDLDLVLIDALNPFGGEACLPAGLLREPLSVLCSADALVLTRSNALSDAQREGLLSRLHGLASGHPVIQGIHKPAGILEWGSEAEAAPETIRGKGLFLFCGIGNPAGFKATIHELTGCGPVKLHIFPDHFHYNPQVLKDLAEECDASPAEAAMTTEKDIVKIRDLWPGRKPLKALRVKMEMTANANLLDELLERALAK